MKKIISIFIAMLMLLSIVAVAFAEENTTTDSGTVIAPAEVTSETGTDVETVVTDGLVDEGSEVTDAGTTPDSPLWGIERALERIDIALTFNKAKKAEKRLMHARERLLEVSAMAKKGNLKAAAKAAEANAEDVEAAGEDLAGEVAKEGETDKVKTLEARLDRHIAVLEKVAAKLQEKGVDAPGIANALAIAKAKKNLVLAKDAFKQAKKTGEDVEAAKAKLEEAKTSFKDTRSEIRENKKFVKKDSSETEETESSEEASTEPAESSEITEDTDNTTLETETQ